MIVPDVSLDERLNINCKQYVEILNVMGNEDFEISEPRLVSFLDILQTQSNIIDPNNSRHHNCLTQGSIVSLAKLKVNQRFQINEFIYKRIA
tara:strand:- start:217 stop:492 length:276 start_codon:yes stop_codon:yes gene_type:complete